MDLRHTWLAGHKFFETPALTETTQPVLAKAGITGPTHEDCRPDSANRGPKQNAVSGEQLMSIHWQTPHRHAVRQREEQTISSVKIQGVVVVIVVRSTFMCLPALIVNLQMQAKLETGRSANLNAR